MTDRLLYLTGAGLAAMRHLEALPSDHRARSLRAQCLQVWVCAEPSEGWDTWPGAEGDTLAAALACCLEPLDGADLNGVLPIPGDAQLACWIAEQLALPGLESIRVGSGRDQGVVLDRAGRIQIWRRFRFESAHWLPRVPPDHPCGRLHGHGFRVCLYAEQSSADAFAELMADRLGALWAPLYAELHHRCLNEVPGLENPTSEQLAAWIWARLKPDLPALSGIQVEETATAGCRFDGQHHRIWKELRFEAALCLDQAPTQDGRRCYGHSYLIRLHLTAPLDPVLGWTVDYRDIKRLFKPIYDRLDHHLLNELPGLAAADPGHLLHWVRAELIGRLPALDRIDLYPTPETGVALCWGEAKAENIW
ncbi:6-carboxytetrahydropterin synthase [Caldichromatium japonicum]|uniref:6-carboxy-5,6,7,8-tetrahydropterin synthase n=1 Tax=Caldichromatium japonicum TaxID=2699430 RepID=A0A6G7VFC2_9GAMM|nr:6-carboxytetrahydropterin synthase [Caldichromatium japonicum]QIK38783.1 6-carboxytetrahydropterin synthase [Caldichromatium japonicum]